MSNTNIGKLGEFSKDFKGFGPGTTKEEIDSMTRPITRAEWVELCTASTVKPEKEESDV